MEYVAPYPFADEHIGQELDVAIADWSGLPDLAAEWPDWDDGSRFGYLIDWPVAEERTQRLLALMAVLAPDDERAVRLQRLQRLVAQNRPVLAALQASMTADQAAVPVP